MMRISVYFSPETLTNSYIIHLPQSTNAVVVDPQVIDLPFFELIEHQGLCVKAVVYTHGSERMAHAIRTLRRIWQIEVYGGSDFLEDVPVNNVKMITHFQTAGLVIQPLFLPGHYLDSIVYRIGDYLFPGDIMSAGMVTDADGPYGKALLIECIKESVLELSGHTLILPANGPPSTLEIERKTNVDLMDLLE